jgi:hypothetical protein
LKPHSTERISESVEDLALQQDSKTVPADNLTQSKETKAMLHRPHSLRVALTILALVGLALPAVAQQAPKDMVPLKFVVTGTFPTPFVVPVEPPIWILNVSGWTGEAEGIGPITYVESSTAQLGVDGALLSINNATAVITAANGDAIFLRFSGLVRSTGCDHQFVVTGGKGRFAGATGSGKATGDLKALTFEGMVSKPAAKPQ